MKKSKGKGKQRAGDVTQAQRDRLERSLFWWRLRGVLWVVTLVGTVLVYAAGEFLSPLRFWQHVLNELSAALNYRLTRIPSFLGAPSLCWTICSILWAAWDPTYATKRRDELQGRQIRQVGKRQYNVRDSVSCDPPTLTMRPQLLQTFAWLSRLVASILFTLSHYRPSHDYIRLHDPSSLIPRIYCFALLFLEVFVSALLFAFHHISPHRCHRLLYHPLLYFKSVVHQPSTSSTQPPVDRHLHLPFRPRAPELRPWIPPPPSPPSPSLTKPTLHHRCPTRSSACHPFQPSPTRQIPVATPTSTRLTTTMMTTTKGTPMRWIGHPPFRLPPRPLSKNVFGGTIMGSSCGLRSFMRRRSRQAWRISSRRRSD